FLWINGRRRRFWLLLVLWSISVVAAEIQPHLPALSRLVILRFMPNFLPGVIAYCIGAGLWRKNFHLSGFWWMPFILLLVGIFTQSRTFRTGGSGSLPSRLRNTHTGYISPIHSLFGSPGDSWQDHRSGSEP